MEFSKTQIDKLGERLKQGIPSQHDLQLLDGYRRSFGNSFETVVAAVRERLRVNPSGRPAKTTHAILEKIRRESIRPSQIQDIAGCRVIVDDIIEQDTRAAVEQRRVDHEVVLLSANSEADLRRTHSRYFEDLDSLVQRLENSTNSFIVRERKD